MFLIVYVYTKEWKRTKNVFLSYNIHDRTLNGTNEFTLNLEWEVREVPLEGIRRNINDPRSKHIHGIEQVD